MTSAWFRASGGARARDLEQLARRINTPLPVRRRIGVASIGRRSGTTTIASELALMLALMRPDRLLMITTDDPGRSRFAQLRSPHTVRHLTPDHWSDPLSFWGEVVGDAQRNHDLTITDWGAAPLPQLSLIATDSHALCLVTAADRGMIQSTLDVATALSERLPVLLAVADVRGEVGPSIRALVRGLPLTSILQRHDHRQNTRKKLREPDAFEMYRLAASLIGVLTRPAKGRTS